MTNNTVLSLIIAMSLASGGFAYAQGNSPHHRRDPQHERYDERRPPQHPGYRAPDDDRPQQRGAGPNHDFRQGDRLPAYYRHSQYVVDDWRGYHLSAPPRGYHWVQTGSDYVLVAIASGVILQLLLSN